MPHSARASDYFTALAESYDSLIGRAVPRYGEMLDSVVEYAPTHASAVLELGCGSGNLSTRLAARWPNASFTFVDASVEMLRIAESRLVASHQELVRRSSFRSLRFEDLSESAPAFDVVASSISLHHVLDKGRLYRAIRSSLRHDGVFVFADQLLGRPLAIHSTNWSGWLAHCRANGSCDESEIEGMVRHAAEHDHYVSLIEHFELLSAAGFAQLDCVWRLGMWGTVTAMDR